MHLMGAFLAVIVLTIASPLIKSEAGSVKTEVFIGEDGLREFFRALGDHYRVPESKIFVIRERGIPPCEIPVVLFIAKRAHLAPEVITDFRLRDNSWLQTTLRFGLGPEIFYIPVGVLGRDPFYSKVYGYFKHKPKEEWKTIVLSDEDIINLVNLKLMSEHYRYPPERIIEMRSQGKEFISINDEIRKEKKKINGH